MAAISPQLRFWKEQVILSYLDEFVKHVCEVI